MNLSDVLGHASLCLYKVLLCEKFTCSEAKAQREYVRRVVYKANP
jgi:hypothetical protein